MHTPPNTLALTGFARQTSTHICYPGRSVGSGARNISVTGHVMEYYCLFLAHTTLKQVLIFGIMKYSGTKYKETVF